MSGWGNSVNKCDGRTLSLFEGVVADEELVGEIWLGGRDSNPDSQIQSLESYHWTTSQQGKSLYEFGPTVVN